MSNNRAYQNLAGDVADILNEQNEAYVSGSNSDASANMQSSSSRPNASNPGNPPAGAGNSSSQRNSGNQTGSSNNPTGGSSSQAGNSGNQNGGSGNQTRSSGSAGNSASAEQAEVLEGHDEVFVGQVTKDYECPICMMVLRNPVQTPCGHRFCGSCINRHIATNGPTCPIDNQELNENEIYADNFAKREINQLAVKCRTLKNKKDCQWTGVLQNVEDHLKKCEFVEVPCPKGCNQNIEKKSLDHHLKKECSKRTITCSHCKTEVQHKNHKDHLGKCQKVTVACPNCNKKMLREKLTAGHEKECPKAQAVCEFKQYGCTWKGLRLNVQNHMKDDASMSAHVSMLCAALSVLFPGNGKNKGGASRSDGSGGSTSRDGGNGTIVDELNRQRNKNTDDIASLDAKFAQLEKKYRDFTVRIERQQAENETRMTTFRNDLRDLEARMCNGVYLWRIVGYARQLENARDNIVTALHSPPFYTSFYGYKLCLRINPNGVDTGYGSHVSLFVHMMQSEWDDTLEWPFSGRISLSILDQSEDSEYKRHISETLVTRPNLLAFQRPTTPRNHKGYGYVEFAHIETLEERQYVKNDCLLIRVQVFQ